MLVVCPTCKRSYDDAARWTLCPHAPLGAHPKSYCPICDTVKEWQGPCKHQQGEQVKTIPYQECCNGSPPLLNFTVEHSPLTDILGITCQACDGVELDGIHIQWGDKKVEIRSNDKALINKLWPLVVQVISMPE